MSLRAEQYRAEREQYRQTKAYYASIRRPRLERVTFTLAFIASVLVSLRWLGIGITDYEPHGQWLTVFYCIAFIVFIGLDSVFAKAHRPVPIPFGGFNPSRMYEKFVMQGRAWQLLARSHVAADGAPYRRHPIPPLCKMRRSSHAR